MTYKITIANDKLNLADELEEEFHEEAKGIIEEASTILQQHTQAQLSRYSGPGRTPEGQPPALRTGALLRSIKTIRAKVKGRIVSGGIISRDPGANRVEYGATDSLGRRTLPHPFVRPAMETARPVIDALFADRMGARER